MNNVEVENRNFENEIENAQTTKEQAMVMKNYMDSIIAETQRRFEFERDEKIIAQRGARLLTSEESKFYDDFSKVASAKNGVSHLELTLPTSIIEKVFDDLEKEHPLLQCIDFRNVTGLTEILTRTTDSPISWWGKIDSATKESLTIGFEKVKVNILSLGTAIPVPIGYIKMGPVWLDAYVRTFLMEGIYSGMQKGFYSGTGKDEPIGMIKNLKGSVVEGVYPDKTPLVITNLEEQIFDIYATLTADGKRTIPADNIICLVNPVDYYSKIQKSYMKKNALGEWVFNFPLPVNFLEIPEVEKGKGVIGIGKKYFAGFGQSEDSNFSDDVHFLENERVYKEVMYGNACPVDNDSFIYLSFETPNV